MNIKDHIVGFVFVFGVAVVLYHISLFHLAFDALVTSLVIGLFVGSVAGFKDSLEKGGEAALKIVLPLGVLLFIVFWWS